MHALRRRLRLLWIRCRYLFAHSPHTITTNAYLRRWSIIHVSSGPGGCDETFVVVRTRGQAAEIVPLAR